MSRIPNGGDFQGTPKGSFRSNGATRRLQPQKSRAAMWIRHIEIHSGGEWHMVLGNHDLLLQEVTRTQKA